MVTGNGDQGSGPVNSSCLTIAVPGAPISWKRARRCGQTYFDAQKADKTFYAWTVKEKWRREASSGPYSLHMQFRVPMPSSWSKKKKKEHLGKPVSSRPDIDNYVKFILDALQGVVWNDDSAVTEILATKIYSIEPCTILHINTL
jgi:Holliday junction resolvase RusA-like endonuclease